MAVVHITNETFEKEVMQAEGKVLVDFWASWCGPCRMLGPVIDQLPALNLPKHFIIRLSKWVRKLFTIK